LMYSMPLQPEQMTFSFATKPSYLAEDFLVSDCNRKAWMWMQPHHDWPAPVFLLRGMQASGKSHLAAIWAARSNAPILAANSLLLKKPPQEYFSGGKTLVVEDIEQILHEPALFHLYNYAMHQEYSLLLTLNAATDWSHFQLADLRSRLQAAPQASIHEPDDMLLAALLIKHFSDRQLLWQESLITYLVPRMERSFASVSHIVSLLDAEALKSKQPLSVALARRVLTEN
jgi:chromosomal replication initiation ATPase DnaA